MSLFSSSFAAMSYIGVLEIIPSVYSLKWTVAGVTSFDSNSHTFEFNGAVWSLRGRPCSFGEPDGHYALDLVKVWGGACRRPFRVSVEALQQGGRDVPGLSPARGGRRLPEGSFAWEWPYGQMVRVFPDFVRRPLTFLVVLKTGDFPTPADIEPTGESLLVAWNSFEFRENPCQESLAQDFSRMLEDQDSSKDVEFRCGGESTRAHGVVVSARSQVIAAMLSSDMVEGRTWVVKIPNMEPEVFRHFLRYLYTGTLPPELTVELALNLYEVGDQYAVHGLASVCTEYLVRNITVQNACDVLVVADAHHNARLREAVINFMVAKGVPWTSDRWKDFCEAHPMLAIDVYHRTRIDDGKLDLDHQAFRAFIDDVFAD